MVIYKAILQDRDLRARNGKSKTLFLCTATFGGFVLVLAVLCFVPQVRDQFFTMNLWPWSLPSEVTQRQLKTMQSLARPGDVILETNMHYWQWVSLSEVFTGSSWVHSSLVDANGELLTVAGKVQELPISIYLKWRSTRIALVRPSYAGQQQIRRALAYGRSELGIPYDPSFYNANASCTGLVAESLKHAGIDVPSTTILGRKIYAARSFFCLPGARLIWTSDGNGSG